MDIFIGITLFIWFQERLVQGADACVMRVHSCEGVRGEGQPFHRTLIRKVKVIDAGSSHQI
jgi:hypothetical protein